MAVTPADSFTRYAKARVLEMLKIFFSTLPDKKLRFNFDPSFSEIQITDKYVTQQENVEPKPKIVVERGDISFQNRTIGNQRGGRNLSAPGRSLDAIDTTIVVRCYSEVPDVSDQIADHVSVCLHGLRRIWVETLTRLKDLRVLNIGSERLTRSDSRPEEVEVPVVVRVTHTVAFNLVDTDTDDFDSFRITVNKSLC